MSRSTTSANSITSSRVTPARQPEESGGVISTPSTTRNTLVPVPSQRWPAVLANSASLHPTRLAVVSASTFSAYDVVFRPTSGPCSLRLHCTRCTRSAAGQTLPGPVPTTSVPGPSPRPDPHGPAPLDHVIRSSPAEGSAASTSWMAVRMRSLSGSSRPSPDADRSSRRRWRLRAKAAPSTIFIVSNTPSPTTTAWSSALTVAVPGSTSRPSTQQAPTATDDPASTIGAG